MSHQTTTGTTQRHRPLRLAAAGLLAPAVAVVSCGGGGSSGDGGGATGINFPPPTYTPARQGTPTGTAVTQTIDGTGGAVKSADGLVDVTFPAGALSAATQVTVQPITSTTPNGVGAAYRLTPEGTTLAQPETLTFHLSDAQAIGVDSTWVATQHADGLWYSQPNQQRDAAAKTVSVSAKHFSDWAVAETVLLKPQTARVHTGTSIDFTPMILMANPDTEELATPTNAAELAVPVVRVTPQPTLRLQIKHGIAIGPGKADLLEAIAATGSINEACKMLQMSYRGGWALIQSMNEHFVGPLVEKSKGGASRGGATLTPLGIEVLELYRLMEWQAVEAIRPSVTKLESVLKPSAPIGKRTQ